MRITFCVAHWGYLRNFDRTLVQLAERGHAVHVLAQSADTFGNQSLVDELRSHGLTVGWLPDRRDRLWWSFTDQVRHALNFIRFASPRYSATPTVRELLEPRLQTWLARLPLRFEGHHALTRVLDWALRVAERAVPVDRSLVGILRDASPDLLMVTPLLGVSEHQFDILRAANHLGIRTCLPVNSWDNLSTGAELRFRPQRLLVWNAIQRHEAVADHGVSEDSVVITGAQCFDRWFERQPSRSRAEFCRRVGLDPDHPYVLYVCSALMDATDEARYAGEWVRLLRNCEDPLVRQAGILVRPHPQRMRYWDESGVRPGETNYVLWGENPVDGDSRAGYFDSMAHAAAVVGISSTAMIEAGFLGKPVLTRLDPRLRFNQFGLRHFSYLLGEEGLLVSAETDTEHLEQLGEALRQTMPDERSLHFSSRFARPFGLRVPGTPRVVEAVEQQLSEPPPTPLRPTLLEISVRLLLVPWVLLGAAMRRLRQATEQLMRATVIGLRRARMRRHRLSKAAAGAVARLRKSAALRWHHERKRVRRAKVAVGAWLTVRVKRVRRGVDMALHRAGKWTRWRFRRIAENLRKRRRRWRKRIASLLRRLRGQTGTGRGTDDRR